MSSYLYEELTWQQARAAAQAGKVCVIPVGTTEQHGPHLPLSVDCITSQTLSRLAVERCPDDALLLPRVSYSFNEHHLDFPGTIAIAWDHIIPYLVDIGKSLAHHRFCKILFVNGHGSNRPFLDIAGRLITNQTDAIAASVSWWSLGEPAISETRESEFPGGMSHACELETSVLLHLRPDLVDMSKAVKEIGFQKSKFHWHDLNKQPPLVFMDWWSRQSSTGIIGDPTLATAEKGQKIVACVVSNLVELIQDFKRREISQRRDYH
jgi:creatinine amidohydrolase